MTKDILLNQDAIVMVSAGDLRELVEELLSRQNAPTEEPLYTPDEFAQRKRISKATLWRWCRNGILQRTVIGGKVFFKESNLITNNA